MRNLLLLSLLVLPLAACTDGDGDDNPIPEDFDLILSDERPTKRSEVIAVPHEDTASILVFGGNDGPIVNQNPRASFLGDTWVFEVGFGWTRIEDEGPSARGRYGATLDSTNGRALVFGGRYRDAEADSSDDYELFADLWAFDFETRTWDRLDNGSSSNGGPSRRYYPQVHWSPEDEALYVWGGLTNENPLWFDRNDELWKWTDADGWTELTTSGDGPSLRAFYGSTIDVARNRMVLFAGQVGDFQSLAYNDTFALDLTTGEWEELDPGGDDAPFTRMLPHMMYDGNRDRILAFGGHTDIGDDNDLWEIPPTGGSWNLINEGDSFTGNPLGCLGNSAEVPADYVDQDLSAPERRQKAMAVLMFDNLWLFGGMHAECSDHLDDTWRYELATDTWTELIEARTGESCARRGDDCECLCI